MDDYFITCVYSKKFNSYVAEIRELGCVANGPTFIDAINAVKKQGEDWVYISKKFKEEIPKPINV